MMHVDKNADDHVVDQNVDQILRKIAYVPLGGGIRFKRSSCMQYIYIYIYFFFLNKYKICLPGGRRILAHAFRGPRIFGLWLMFSEDQRFWILAHVFKDLGFLGLAHVFRGPRVSWALAHVFRGPKVPDPGSCFQRPRIFGSWLMFSEDQGFFGL